MKLPLIRVILLLPVFGMLILGLGGCWSSVELNDRAFVNIMMFDLLEDGQLELTLGFPLPNRMIPGEAGGSGGESKPPYSFVSKTGQTLPHILQVIQEDITRDISFGQTRVIIVGDKLAKQQGIDPILELISRHRSFHISANLFVMKSPIIKLVNTPTTFERFISAIIRSYISNKMTIDTTLRDILRSRYGYGDILVPILTIGQQPEEISKLEKADTWLGTDGLAIFKNGKMLDTTFNKDNLRATLWVMSAILDTIITVPSPTDGEEISCEIRHLRTKIFARKQNDEPVITIQSKAQAIITSTRSNLDLTDTADLLMAEKALIEELKERIRKMIAITKQEKADVFHFYELVNWKYPGLWNKLKNDWRNYYAQDLQIDYKFSVKIIRTGETYLPTKLERNKRQ